MTREVIHEEMTAVILAGGKATRLGGIDKPRLKVAGQPLIERIIGLLAPLFSEVIVAAGEAASYADLGGVRVVWDQVPNLGPLGGIRAGLAASHTPWVFVVAGDMPRLRASLLARIASHAGPDLVAVVPRHGEHLEPLHAAYHRRLLPEIDRLVDERRLRIAILFERCPTRYVEVTAMESLAFANLNRPEDLALLGSRLPPDSPAR